MAILTTSHTDTRLPLLLLPLLSLLLCGCYTDFDPEIESSHTLCMNSLVKAGEPIEVRLTRTWTWDEGIPEENFNIEVADATVRLYVNDQYVETLVPAEVNVDYSYPTYPLYYEKKQKGFTTTDYLPEPGDRIRLVAESLDYGQAEASTTVPYPVAIDCLEISVSDISVFDYSGYETTYTMDLDLRVWFTDPVGEGDRYRFDTGVAKRHRAMDEDGMLIPLDQYIWSSIPDMTKEPLFAEHMSPLEAVISSNGGYTIFSDRTIDGRQYPLHVAIPHLQYCVTKDIATLDEAESPCLSVKLERISEEYYRHVLSVWAANDGIAGSLGSVGLGNLVYAHSNVSTGAGVVASEASSEIQINMLRLVRENL